MSDASFRFPVATFADKPNAPVAAVLATVPASAAATTLADFGYHYTPAGTLRHMGSGLPFLWLGQKHYDKLGDAIVAELYATLEGKYGMLRLLCPLDAVDGEPTCPVFVSPGYETREVVVYICQGSGAVRPGMWARQLCTNNSLQDGSIFPYVEDAYSRGWGVVVLNPNENTKVTGSMPEPALREIDPAAAAAVAAAGGGDASYWLGTPDAEWKNFCRLRDCSTARIRGSSSPEEHAAYTFTTLLSQRAPAVKHILIVAHSYGGKCTTSIVRRATADATQRVRAIALTDAINDVHPRDPPAVLSLLQQCSINWLAHKTKPLDAEMTALHGCRQRAAGHHDHVYTSESCRPSVFAFFDQTLATMAPSTPAS